MADAVQYVMEKMIPELEDLQQLQIFTKEEVRQIVQKRRDFEYTMKRTPLRKVDCLRYIEYELNLDALRRQRKKRLGLQKQSSSDHTGMQRVHNIFDRALMKHRGDVDLWLQHIAFCKNTGSSKLLSKLFTNALQLHPRNETLWIEAASWEFSTNLNVDSARVLMQRSIRMNPHSKKLWLEYFRLEFLYVQKLRTRREVLGLDADTTKPLELSLDIAPVKGEGAAQVDAIAESAKESAVDKSRHEILQGAIPKIVYRNASHAIPNDAAFRLQFVSISNLFPATYGSPVAKVILESSLADFPTDAAVWSAYCEQAMHESDTADVDARRKVALERFRQAIKSNVDTDAMRGAFMRWCIAELARTPSSPWFAHEMFSTISTLGPQTPTLYRAYIDYTLRVSGLLDALAVAAKANAAFPTDGMLWQLRAQLAMRQAAIQQTHALPPSTKRPKKQLPQSASTPSVYKSALAVVEQGLREAMTDTDGLHQRHIQLLINSHAKLSAVKSAFERAVKAATAWTPAWSALRMQFLQWTLRTQGVDAARTLYKTFLAGQMLPRPETLALLRWCVQVEAAQPDSLVATAAVKGLMEKLVDLFGQSSEDIWVNYVQYYRELGLHKEANEVHWRATRVFPSSTALATLQELN
ncbi:hypothetical protein H310_03430 [Aphanomyces invadans]|uniref:U3 small nucleolar RNA-associated protein 6 n=1 Tax=Aphanomyces invadans TaxID=157072 RepID=A0A024UHP5_9STRA|nr:hypothetical protein H310_03430 [Aphanomyces invadans]ETW05730.1 hypothetical protein H310_03430 [Aphanomyces invadans]|eukprot:XP_008865507.1 hypothetical protein H310_03430 [Aphanomyces invadans]